MAQETNKSVDPNRLARAVRQRLESLAHSGLTNLPNPSGQYLLEGLPNGPSETAESVQAQPVVTRPVHSNKQSTPSQPTGSVEAVTQPADTGSIPAPQLNEPYPESLGPPERESQLSVLAGQVAECQRCGELARCRTQTVFGVGTATPRLCFVGEGPGADEDRLGEPFVGAAGQLLTKIIEACKMRREDVYILNTVKCRPPGNRNPSEAELENCWAYAEKQLEILQPEFICCLGSVAARTLLSTKQSIGRMRQQFFQYQGSQVVVTYHPAYLLRTPSAKKQVWADMKMLMNAMGHQI